MQGFSFWQIDRQTAFILATKLKLCILWGHVKKKNIVKLKNKIKKTKLVSYVYTPLNT